MYGAMFMPTIVNQPALLGKSLFSTQSLSSGVHGTAQFNSMKMASVFDALITVIDCYNKKIVHGH